MADRKAKLVDGYTTMKAAQQAHNEGKLSEAPASAPEQASEKKKPEQLTGARIGRTAMPSRVEIICYACGADFEIVGKTESTVCTKCRQKLQVVDHTITSEWSEEITTAGTITLGAGAVVKDVALVANRVVIDGGKLDGGTVRASRQLDLVKGKFDASCMEGLDLRVGENIRQAMKDDTLSFRNVELHGELNTHLELSGTLTIHPGACLRGSVTGAHLVVEDGGGLKAALCIQPDDKPQRVKKSA